MFIRSDLCLDAVLKGFPSGRRGVAEDDDDEAGAFSNDEEALGFFDEDETGGSST